MAEDYTSSFNSYSPSPVNKALSYNMRGDNSHDKDFFSIYISGIPKEVNEEAFVKKCEKYGVIARQKIFENGTAYSWIISYSSEEEARHALKELHMTPPLHLDVRYANKKKFAYNEPSTNFCHQKQNSFSLKDRLGMEDQVIDYQNEFGRGQFLHKSDTSLRDTKVFVSYDKKRDVMESPLSESETRPQYIDRGTSLSNSRPQNRNPGQITSLPSGRSFETNYDDTNPYHTRGGRNSSHVERDFPTNCVQVNRSDLKKFISQPPPLVLFTCFRCEKSGYFHCSHCRTPYCSRDCQNLDWHEHEKMCKSTEKDPTYSDSSSLSSASNFNGYSSDNTNLNRQYEPKLINLTKHQELIDLNVKSHSSESEAEDNSLRPLSFQFQNSCSRLPKKSSPRPSLGRGGQSAQSQPENKSLGKGNFMREVEKPSKILKYGNLKKAKFPESREKVDGKMKVSQVRFVDYGGTERVNLKDLYILPEQLMKYPARAVPCTLPNSDITSNVNSDEIKKLFTDITLGNEFKVFNVKGSDELCELSLVNSDGVSVSSLLDVHKSSILLSCLESSVEGKENSSPETESSSKIPTIYTELKAGSKIVISAALEEDNKVWILASFPNSTFAEDIGKLDSLENLKTEDVSKMLKVGDVAAGFSTKYGNFYRCIVLNCLKDKLLVRYIDFGNEEEINRCQKLTPELLKIRSCVLRCKCSDTFKKDCASAFQKREVLDGIVTKVMPDCVEITASGLEGEHVITCCSLYQDVKSHVSEQKSQELVSAWQTVSSVPESERKSSLILNLKNCILTPTSVHGEINAPVPNETLSPVQESVVKNKSLSRCSDDGEVSTDVTAPVHTEQLMYCDCEHGSVENGDHKIIIVYAEKDTVAFMLEDEKIIRPFTQLTRSINDFCTQLQCSSYNGQSIVNGQMVLAKYGEEWFRACVLDISPDDSHYEVYFVDFGNTEPNVKRAYLRKMEPQFMSFKIHAHIGELKGYSYRDGTKDAIMEQLQNFTNVAIEANVEKDPNYQDAGFYCLNIPQITRHLVELNLATVQT